MRIYVCVKQVPDTSGKVAVNANGTLDRASMATITNPDDLAAVEAALKLKDETGAQVTVVSMGPPPAEGMLRECIAMGADDAVLISGREFGGSDTFATSQIIAGGLSNLGVGPEDIIFCGRQAIDGDTAQVGPQIAEKLNIPQVTYAAEIHKNGNTLTVKRLLEDGYMTVKGILECYKKPFTVLDYEALKDEPLIDPTTIGLKGSPTNIFRSFTPPQKGAGKMLQGSNEEMVKELAESLAKKHVI